MTVATPLTGIGVSPGTAAGPVARMAAVTSVFADSASSPGDPATEAGRALAALLVVADELEERATTVTGVAAEVLGTQALMARDPALADAITAASEQGLGAAAAVTSAFGDFRRMMESAGPYLAGRVADLDDITARACARLAGVEVPTVPSPGHPFVLVAVDLAPADTATLDPSVVLAIVTEHGGPTSHTAILAKSLGIPAIVGCAAAANLGDGAFVLVDGDAGAITVDPSASLVNSAADVARTRAAELARHSGPGRTSDGTAISLLANLGGLSDLDAVAAADTEGIGLFRTEFLYLDRQTPPTVAEQTASYSKVFVAFAGRKVVVRTLDAGADKPLPFVGLAEEPNPALGIRGYRTARLRPELLADQLIAIAAAARESPAEVWVMAPMISTPAEGAAFYAAARGYGLATVGAMVEVPAAALRAGALLAGVDFVSLGTNDLAQYCLATDRLSGGLADLLNPWQPALLELVRLTASAGVAAGKPVGVCGEAASNPLLALVLVGLGVTSLSMATVAVPAVRAALATHSSADCEKLARLALEAPDAVSGRAAVTDAS